MVQLVHSLTKIIIGGLVHSKIFPTYKPYVSFCTKGCHLPLLQDHLPAVSIIVADTFRKSLSYKAKHVTAITKLFYVRHV